MRRMLQLLGLSRTRVVLDTNLLVAAYFNPKSASNKILELCQGQKLVLLVTSSIAKEFSYIMNRISAAKNFRTRIEKLISAGRLIEKTIKIDVITEDPDDNKFLSCALAGGADYIITSDKHLLILKKFRGIRIIKPAQFMSCRGLEK
jgi:putative PIN family toxin of toxin-antitoxin system